MPVQQKQSLQKLPSGSTVFTFNLNLLRTICSIISFVIKKKIFLIQTELEFIENDIGLF